ncbi:NAD-dependent deacetylase [Kocuria rhizophila]|uniref:protein acetyllysine N-acetyltransferase n=1 Tax=Kocuria rhizophila TaxID=72000 RepID=A0AAX2SFV9_KOCRH|nr:Sir2 family NAD-dependent protein deacetylase [Kocuria rhizophila]TFI02502.1 NAD-dependent deacetylase [Kocuria rhizophila]TFI06658.1 NAD-dependent deacetylase [Kocuria rhizophila]
MPARVLRAGYGTPVDRDLFPDPHALDARAGLRPVHELLVGRRIAVLTGAGVSTSSGIPDYRGPDAKPRNPMTYQEFMADVGNRRHYWARNQFGWHFVARAEPSAAHTALATLETAGAVDGIITQNIDRLHQKAGSLAVVDLHGTYAWVVCTSCHSRFPREEVSRYLDELNPGFYDGMDSAADVEYAPDADATVEHTAGFRVWDCPVCQGVLKPDVVFFGENATALNVALARRMVAHADALLVAGSSLTVNSGRRYVRQAAREGKPVVIVNHGVTGADELATLKVDAQVGEFLTDLASLLVP